MNPVRVDPQLEPSEAPSTEPSNNPFRGMRGLVGGDGEVRAEHRLAALYEHRTVLHPYDRPADREAARAFCAAGNIEVEIGFGRPHFLRDRIVQAPERRFLAFEVRRSWCEQLAGFLDRENLDNTRVFIADARPLLIDLLEPHSVQAIYVFFPDPWWKKRHEKRRVMSAELLDVAFRLLAPGGAIELRTDVEPYFERVQALFAADGRFRCVDAGKDDQGRPLPLSHREKKCAEVGTRVFRIRAVLA